MIIINSKRNKRIKVISAESIFQLSKGLMFKKKGRLLLKFPYEIKHGIWTLFMGFTLDLIFIDKNKKIVDIIENVCPLSFNPKTWRIYRPKKKCMYVLELESGFTEKNKFKVGDVLKF